MKYTISNETIPHDRRADINAKVLHIIDTGIECGITQADIFNAYTGDGGLHGLQFSDFTNRHDYTEAKKEIEHGQFFTPHTLCEFIVNCIKPSQQDMIADLTCGMGNFFNYAPVESNVYGNEIDIKAYKVAKHLYPSANLSSVDVRYYKPDRTFDIVFGNPPFNLQWDEYLSQLYYCIKSAELLRPGGILALVVPNSFLSDEFMDGGMVREMNERYSFIVQMDLPSNAFRSYDVNNFDTKFMVFQRRSEHIAHAPYTTNKVAMVDADTVYDMYIRPVIEQKNALRHRLFFEHLHANREDQEFASQVKKLLYDIRRNPHINTHYAKCMQYVDKYYTQVKPDNMKWEEWVHKRITKDMVLSHLCRIVRNQHVIEEDRIGLVKTNYGLRIKAYSHKTRQLLGKTNNTKSASFVEMVRDDYYPFEDHTYANLVQRKRREYERQDANLKQLSSVPQVDGYSDRFTLYDSSTGETIHLNTMQRSDMSKLLQKRYGILNWQQGSGKTIAGIAWYKSLSVRNVFIVSAALAINLTWKVKLTDYGEDFTVIKSIHDINNIKPGQVVLVTFNMLCKYQRQIKKYVRMQSQKVALIVDESDELTNHKSKRTRATLSCFRRVRYKLLTTGTTTRNNINELYPQLELLYNNSVNMLCECEDVYEINKEQEIEEHSNAYYNEPFPAYHGRSLFKSCFCPSKVTVFGVKKYNQDIYNRDSLESIIEKTILTRKFEEIVGEKKYDVITHRISQNDAEHAVYSKIINEFHEMLHYFHNTGNSRKESMLMLIRQIQLLIKSTSVPHLMDEYDGSSLPNKYEYITQLVQRFDTEKVAIGTVFIDAAEEYASVLRSEFPRRQVFLVKGDVTFRQRADILERFESTSNGILVSTQQSLKSSVNIPTCNRIIIESMQWNIPRIEQYYFRFIRYNSTQHKQVHFVTYDHTIEQNLLALLMTKERINEYIKTLDFKDESDIFDEYDIDMGIFDSIIEKERDEDGKLRLTWGQQKVV